MSDAVFPSDFQEAVNLLTNWRRNQWARAGYPGLRQKDAEKVWPFIHKRRFVPA